MTTIEVEQPDGSWRRVPIRVSRWRALEEVESMRTTGARPTYRSIAREVAIGSTAARAVRIVVDGSEMRRTERVATELTPHGAVLRWYPREVSYDPRPANKETTT